MSTEFPLNSKVRFTQERLAALSPRDRAGLEGRVGKVQTDGKLVTKPTVYFPTDGKRPELRLFRVDPRQLELVEGPPPETASTSAPLLNEGVGYAAPSAASADVPPAEPEGGGNLSQSDLDNFFD